MVKRLCLFLTAATLVVSCDNKKVKETVKEVDSTVESKVDSTISKVDSLVGNTHNAMNSLDVNGIYKGVVPCADCEGIEKTVTLGVDNTYIVSSKYLGKGDGKAIEVKGKYIWDKDGTRIKLEGDNSWYKVQEGKLIQLDTKGAVIEGKLAEKYMLTKEK